MGRGSSQFKFRSHLAAILTTLVFTISACQPAAVGPLAKTPARATSQSENIAAGESRPAGQKSRALAELMPDVLRFKAEKESVSPDSRKWIYGINPKLR